MKGQHSAAYRGYYSDLLLAVCLRVIFVAAGLALLASLAACKNGGDIDLTLKGTAAPKPTTVVGGPVN